MAVSLNGHQRERDGAQTLGMNPLRPIISFIGIIHWAKTHIRPVERVVLSCHQPPCCSFSSSQPRFNTKPEVDYRFPLHFYLLNALSLFCGLLRAMGLRHRGPLISNSVNKRLRGETTRFFFFFLHRIKATSHSSISIFLLTAALSLFWEFSLESTQREPHILGDNGRLAVSISYYLIILNQWLLKYGQSYHGPHQWQINGNG